VLLAVSQLEPRWEAELTGVEFAVEEIPPMIPDADDPEPVDLARLEVGSARTGPDNADSSAGGPLSSGPLDPGPVGLADSADPLGPADLGLPEPPEDEVAAARIVLYRRPLMARAEGEEELAELVLDVIVEQFANYLGIDPQIVDPGYPGEE
jgi:hypothetical protein